MKLLVLAICVSASSAAFLRGLQNSNQGDLTSITKQSLSAALANHLATKGNSYGVASPNTGNTQEIAFGANTQIGTGNIQGIASPIFTGNTQGIAYAANTQVGTGNIQGIASPIVTGNTRGIAYGVSTPGVAGNFQGIADGVATSFITENTQGIAYEADTQLGAGNIQGI